VSAATLLTLARSLAASRWALPALLVVVALAVTCQLEQGRRAADRARAAEIELRRQAEARALAAEGLLVAERRKAGWLEENAQELLDQHHELAAEVERLKASSPGARPVATAQLTTGPVVAGHHGSGLQEGAAAAQRHDPQAADGAGAPSCLLHAGDLGEVRVAGVVFETRAGNVVPVFSLEAWRLTPPAALLFGGPVRADLSRLSMLEPDPPAREAGWGGGVVALGTGQGWAVGPLVAAPPLRLWRLQIEAAGGAAAGPTGTWAAVATAVARWR
jgi:hypothetical protein